MKKLTEMSIKEAVIRTAFPAILSHLFIVAYEMVDLFWLDKLGYSEVFASLGAASFITWSLYSIMHVIIAGVTSYTSRYRGANNEEGYSLVTFEGFIYAAFLSFFITFVMHITHVHIFRIIGLTDGILTDAALYFRAINLGFVVLFLYTLVSSVLNAHGYTKSSMYLQLFMLLLNGIFDPFLILGFGGFPALGIAGAAWASVIARLIGLIVGVYLLLNKNLVNFKYFTKVLKMTHFAKIIKIGMPITLIHWIFAMVYPVITVFITKIGNMEALGALNICHKIEGVAYFIAVGFAVSSSTLGGQHYGARNYSQVRGAVNTTVLFCSIILGVISVLFVFVPEKLLGLIVSSPEIIFEGARYLRIIGYFEIFLGLEIVYEGGFTGLGKTYYPMIVSIPVTLFRIPLAYFFAFNLDMAETGLWWAISITTLLKGLLIGGLFLYKTHQKRFDNGFNDVLT